MPSAGQDLQSPGKWSRGSLEHSVGTGLQGEKEEAAWADTPGSEYMGFWAGPSAGRQRGQGGPAEGESRIHPLSFQFGVASSRVYKLQGKCHTDAL